MATYATYNVELITLEPFRIGAITDPMSGIDNPVATVGKRVVIQGPSLKGALRSEIERHLIDKYKGDQLMKPCIPSSQQTLSNEEKQLIQSGKFREGGSCFYSERSKSSSICPSCYFLGAQGLAGFVRVPYLYSEIVPEMLYSVRIDRAIGVVREKTNRNYQLISDNTKFIGKIEVLLSDPVKDWEIGKPRPQIGELDNWLRGNKWTQESLLNEFILERIRAIDSLGGFKSKGFGKVTITVQPEK